MAPARIERSTPNPDGNSQRSYGHFIDGKEQGSLDGSTFTSIDPWTQTPWARVALGSPADADRAVTAARQAFDIGPWPKMSFEERGRLLHRFADLIIDNADELGSADTRDMGKPISQSVENDVPRTAANFRFFADHARLSLAHSMPMGAGIHAYTRFEPAGVVAAIAPWNFPMMLASWKVAPALAWGNTVVLKPSEDTPVSGTILARLASEAGLPDGVFNVVQGYGPDAVGSALTAEPRVDRLTFTGESSTGRTIAAAAASHLAPVSLELGGKGANIVFSDADIDNAVTWSVRAAFMNSGQICLAGSRLFVQRDIYSTFLEKFQSASAALSVGDPLDPLTEFGPLASESHFVKVTNYINGVGPGQGRILTGGSASDAWVVMPTIIVDAPPTARVVRDEIFGPVVVITPFDDEAEALAMANDTPYGLNAMVFTENLARAHRVSASLRAGSVWVNCFFIRDLRAPFGGVADSGIGREGGDFSREFFTEPKAVVMQLN
jgi:aminomuconate-semialdehyde/2-hydroxymuconate-6-semialdehyde dehydrogenase